MPKPLVCWLVGVGFLFSSPAFATEPEVTSAPAARAAVADEWMGRSVIVKSRKVVLREQPDEKSPAIALSLVGVCLDVKDGQGEWLQVNVGWLRAADVVREDVAPEYFTLQLITGENAFCFLGRARGWLSKNEFDKAHADVSEALRLEPQNPRAFLVRARIAAEQQRADEELANYDRALQLDPADAVALKARGYARSIRGDYDGAIEDYSGAIERLPNNAWLRGARGWCSANKGDYENATSDLTEAIRLDPRNAHAFAVRSTVHLRRRDYDAALADADEAVRLDPKMTHAFAKRGEALAAQGKLDEALRDLDESIRLDAGESYVHNQRGLVHVRKGDLDAAVLDYTQAISLKPNDAYAYYQRAGIWMMKGDQANAVVDLSGYLRLKPDAVDVWVTRGYLRLQSSEDEALQDFIEALRLNPRHVRALVGQAEVFHQRLEQARAIEVLTAAINIAPAIADLYQRRARIRMEQGEWDLAIADCTSGVRADPNDADCLLERAMLWLIRGEHKNVIEDCRAVLTIEPRNTRALNYMASAQSVTGNFNQAIQTYTTALDIDPNDADLLMARASTATVQRQFDLAMADIDRLMTFEGRKADAYQLRAQLWSVQREWDKAAADFGEAIPLKPGEADLFCRRATCWMELNEFDKAIQDADEALRLDHTSAEATRIRQQAMEAKNGPSRLAGAKAAAPQHEGDSVIAQEAEPIVPTCFIELRGPVGCKLALEKPDAVDFGPQAELLPFRLPIIDEALMRFKLVGGKGDAAKDLYMRLESAHLSPGDAARLQMTVPSLTLTEADLDAAKAGTDVVKVVVLLHGEDEKAIEPELEVLTSSPMGRGPELLAEAWRRGAVIAVLEISERLTPLTPLLHRSPDDRFVRFSLDGPEGLRLAHESPRAGYFDPQPLPMPAKFAFLPGIDMRFQLTGLPVPGAEALYGLLKVGAAWPEKLGSPGDTELPIVISNVHLEAAAAGKTVTCVVYLAEHAKEQKSPSIQTLDSMEMPPASDPVAEASRRGTVLATIKLSKELPALAGKPPSSVTPAVDK